MTRLRREVLAPLYWHVRVAQAYRRVAHRLNVIALLATTLLGAATRSDREEPVARPTLHRAVRIASAIDHRP